MVNARERYKRGARAFGEAFAAVGSANTELQVWEHFFPNKRQKMSPIPFTTSTLIGQKGGPLAPQNSATAMVRFKANPPLRRTIKGSVEYWDYYNYEVEWVNSTKLFTPIVHIGAQLQYHTSLDVPNMSPYASRRWFDLQATQGQTAGNFVAAKLAPNSDWIGVSKADIKMDFINLSTLPCWCRITWYRAMEDTSISALQAYKTSIENNKLFSADFTTNPLAVLDPLVGGNETLIDYVDATVASPERMTTMPYINLSSRKHVNEKWRKLASKSWVLSGGSTFQLFNKGDVNCFQSFQSVTDGPDSWMKGMVVCILETQGLASHLKIDAAGPQPLIDGPSLGAGRVGVIVSRHLNIKALKPTVTKYDSTFFGIGSLPVRGNVDQNRQIIDQEMVPGNAQEQT